MKKQRGRKNSKILRGKIERDHYEGKSTTWTHTQLSSLDIDSNVSSASRESIWRLRERERERENYQRHSEDAAETSEQDDRG